MKRLSFFFLLLFVFVTGIRAQGVSENNPDGRGIYIGASLMGTSLEVPDFSDESETGGGLALKLGYNFNTNFALFANLDGSTIDPDEGEDYSLAHFDLGAEGRIGDYNDSFRPFFRASLIGMAATSDSPDGDVEFSGGGLGLGLGLYYFASDNFALELGYTHSWININEVKVGRVSVEVDEEAKTGRLMLGASYHF